jgi:hypothetical protein
LPAHFDLERSNANLMLFATQPVGRFDASVIGINVCVPPVVAHADVGVDGKTFEFERNLPLRLRERPR